ncbi:alpha/beta-hydrolase [Pluteus cervinus]|uniref:Alpha/beta-hydrolase n=1 Tax=Pluteus cervinus TaxID=181527 RepID=A0ACD3B650_9AGAR|nr:alpha/beta-hydrolase [Pluteus cervinus]
MTFSAVSVLIITLLWHFCPLHALTISRNSPDIVNTGYAKYLGNRTSPNSVAYLGIPYAEPPLGERRFRAPLPLDTNRLLWLHRGRVINATTYPDFCVQGGRSSDVNDAGGAGSEDCLKVNIYTPVGANRRSKLPVLFYIHGGGYIFGNPAYWSFNHWIHQSPNVVVVTVYYRLSSFGFLAVPEFRDPKYGDFNAGFKDQIQALRWVKKNIASFGGDPSKVTINGQSAGGSSVELHMVAKATLGEKLFSKAIAQSVYRTPLPTPDQKVALFQFYATQAGCESGSVADQLGCLRKASVGTLAQAQDAAERLFPPTTYDLFQPVIDGHLFDEPPTISILKGRFAKVPLIVGATSNETLTGGLNASWALSSYFPSLNESDIKEIESLYPLSDFDSETQQQEVISGDSELRCARSIMGHASSRYAPTWTYRYNQKDPTENGTAVNHAAENWMMFLGVSGGPNGTATYTPQNPVQIAFSHELIAYWLSFVRTGNPNTFKLPRSPRWDGYNAWRKTRIVLQQSPDDDPKKSGIFAELEDGKETRRCEVVASKAEGQQS